MGITHKEYILCFMCCLLPSAQGQAQVCVGGAVLSGAVSVCVSEVWRKADKALFLTSLQNPAV